MDIRNLARNTLLLIAVTQFAACSSGPPPKQELSLTQASIRSAEAAGAAEYAPKALRTAQQKVESAKSLINKEEYKKAKLVLESALADAELAEASAEAQKSKLANSELQESIDLMKQEIARVQE